jgi:subtilase family serine protease
LLALARRSSLLACPFVLFLFNGLPVCAQVEPRIQGPIDDQQIIRVAHSTHPLAIPANQISRVEPGKTLSRMILLLSPAQESQAGLQQLLDAQQNPHAPQYHRWLTPAEFGARFGAADADIQRITEWLSSKGFAVESVAHGKNSVQFSGAASQVEEAFHTELHYYRANGRQFLANSTDIALPEQIARVVSGVASLNSFGVRPPEQKNLGTAGRNAQGQKTVLSAQLTASGTPNVYYLAPGDFAAIYNTEPLLSAGNDGSGVSIAVTAQSNIELTDVQEFRQIFGLKSNDPNILLSGPDPGITTPIDVQEAMLDVEWAGAVAPGATINLVVAGTTATSNGVDLAAAYAIDNAIAPIVTYTYGGCEQVLGATGNAFYNALWQQAAAQGITVLVATGDNGAAGCDNANSGAPATQGLAVNGAASTPYNVAVGGTQFADSGNESTYWSPTNAADFSSALGYIPEAAWNGSCDPGQPTTATNCAFGNSNFSLLSSGGGASTVYTPKPSWQTGTGVPADNVRDVPDVALAASSGHDQYVYCFSLFGTPCQVNGSSGVTGLTLVGGTSASTPAMAGILALVEQKNGAYQGQIDYVLYKLAQSNSCDSSNQTNPTVQNSCIFYDVTCGNNGVPCAGGSPGCSSQTTANGLLSGFTAGPGYDLVTGLGSVNATNLANNWKNITFLSSQTSLSAAVLSAVHGTPLTLSGTVAALSGSGTPTGNVAFQSNTNGNPTDVLALTNGSFSGAISDLPGGQYALTANYAGDGTYGASVSAPLSFTITPEASTTQITLNPLPGGNVPYGSSLQMIVKVAGASGAGVATGTVTIQDGAATVGVYPLASNGSVTIPSGASSGLAFAPGPHALTAVYSGDNSFNASTSAQTTFVVGKGTPIVIVGANSPNISVGEPLGVHAVVSGSGTALATGTIQFTDNGTAVGPAIPLQTTGFFGTQAQAATLLTGLSQGIHKIGATYDGSADPNYNSVASGDPQNEATFSVTVGAATGAATTTTLSATTLPVNLGDTGTFAVTVKPTTATGTVTLWDAVGPRTAATTIIGGSVSISFPWPQAGSTALYAVYSGDGTFASSSSSTVPFTVNQGIPSVLITAPANSELNQQASVNVTVAGKPSNTTLVSPTGVVEIWDSVNGGPAQLLTVQSLTAGAGNVSVYATRLKFAGGTHALYSHYRGDLNWQAANSPTITLTVSDFTFTIAPDPIAVMDGAAGMATASIAFTAAFTGSVAFTCPANNTTLPAGYTCNIATVDTNATTFSTQMTLNPPASANAMAAFVGEGVGQDERDAASAGRLKPPLQRSRPSAPLTASLCVGCALLAFAFFAFGCKSPVKSTVLGRMAMASSCALFIGSLILGCGGGGGGGGAGTNPVTSSTSVMTSNARVASGQALQITATVSASVAPNGTVQFFDNGVSLGAPQTVSSGTATLQTSSLSVGVHSLKAVYSSSTSTVLGSSSLATTQMVLGSVSFQVTAAASDGLTHSTMMTVSLN